MMSHSWRCLLTGKLYYSLKNTGENNTSGFSPWWLLCLKSHLKYLINVLNIYFGVVKVITGYIFFSAGELPVWSHLKTNIFCWQFWCVKFFQSIKPYMFSIYFVVKCYFSPSEKISVLVTPNHNMGLPPIIKQNNLYIIKIHPMRPTFSANSSLILLAWRRNFINCDSKVKHLSFQFTVPSGSESSAIFVLEKERENVKFSLYLMSDFILICILTYFI